MQENWETIKRSADGKWIVRCVHCWVELKDSKTDEDGKEIGDIKSLYRMAIHKPVCHSDRYSQ